MFQPESIEIDIVVDAALYLWNKCKTVFQKYQTGSLDNPKYLSRMENPTKVMWDAAVIVMLFKQIFTKDNGSIYVRSLQFKLWARLFRTNDVIN